MPNDENIYRIITSRAPVVTGAEPAEVEWTSLVGRVESLEDAPRLLAELDDVNPAGLGDGYVLMWNAADSVWDVGLVQSGLTRVRDWDTDIGDGPYPSLQTVPPVYASQHPGDPSVFRIGVNVGTTASTVAAGNHVHPLPSRFVEPISPGGYMSGGTRSLASRNVTLPAGKSCRVEARIDMQVRGGDPGPCYYRLHLNIDGHTRASGAGENGFWGVSGVPGHPPFSHAWTITGTGSSIPVSASISYYDGGGFYTDAGELVITVRYDR